LLGKVTPKVSLGTADFLIAGRDLQISAFRAPIFRSATGIPARWRCGLKTTRSEQNHTQRPAKHQLFAKPLGEIFRSRPFGRRSSDRHTGIRRSTPGGAVI